MSSAWKGRVGLEVHVRLASRSKLLCACPNRFEVEPNIHICPVCTGQPGSLPALGRGSVELALRAAVLLDFDVAQLSRFDRKHYFYPDSPKGYQVTQQNVPLGKNGVLEVEVNGKRLEVPLSRIHIEEDAGRSVHTSEHTRIDFNRAGVPLVEIVTEPVLETADEVGAFLRRLREELRFAGISDGDMEKGSMRTDVNVSVHRDACESSGSESQDGARVEIKNLNSIRAAQESVDFEIARQTEKFEQTESATAKIAGEGMQTRRWVAATDGAPAHTVLMRTKEVALDYRFLEDPDLLPLALNAADIESARASLGEGPMARRDRWRCEYDLSAYDADVLSRSPQIAAYFEATIAALKAACVTDPGTDPHTSKAAANWIANDLAAIEGGFAFVPPGRMAELVLLVEAEFVSHKSGRTLLAELVDATKLGKAPTSKLREVAAALNLQLLHDPEQLDNFCASAIEARPDATQAWRKGRLQAVDALLGEAMIRSRGKAAPAKLRTRLLAMLEARPA